MDKRMKMIGEPKNKQDLKVGSKSSNVNWNPIDKVKQSSPTNAINNATEENAQKKTRFCHYHVNFGRCTFKEKTGSKCKFLHEMAPMCTDGIRCNRNKCMFNHPKPVNHSSSSFLSQMHPQMIHPWTMLNPWMTQPQNQLPMSQ